MLSKYLSSKISIQRIKVTNSTATIPTAVAITAHYLHLVIFDASPMILPYKLMHPTKKKIPYLNLILLESYLIGYPCKKYYRF